MQILHTKRGRVVKRAEKTTKNSPPRHQTRYRSRLTRRTVRSVTFLSFLRFLTPKQKSTNESTSRVRFFFTLSATSANNTWKLNFFTCVQHLMRMNETRIEFGKLSYFTLFTCSIAAQKKRAPKKRCFLIIKTRERRCDDDWWRLCRVDRPLPNRPHLLPLRSSLTTSNNNSSTYDGTQPTSSRKKVSFGTSKLD